jgi:RNA polymerase sigma factor (sigma-70 family)
MAPFTESGRRISDRWLVAAAQRGDQFALDEILRRYDARLRVIVRGFRLPPGAEPHDILQFARLGLAGAVATWRPGGAPFPIYAVICARRRAVTAVNDACTAGRRAVAEAESLDALVAAGREPACPPGGANGFADPLVIVLAREQLAAIAAATPELTPRQQACLAGQVNGLSYAEVASAIGGTKKSVAMCTQRARARLAAAVGLA